MARVIRAGEAKVDDLVQGYGPHRMVVRLFGFSVQYEPGKTVAELATAGRFPNMQVSYEVERVLANAIRPLGYHFMLVQRLGIGYHHTLTVVYDASGMIQHDLPYPVPGTIKRLQTHAQSQPSASGKETAVKALKRIRADFNTLNSEPIDLVKLAAPGSWQEAQLPKLKPEERVILFDGDGLEVEATIVRDDDGWWMAVPDTETWHDLKSEPSTGGVRTTD